MIFDKLKNAKLYYFLGKNFETALKWLEENQDKLTEMAPGKYPIDGDEVFYLIKHYDSYKLPDCKLENHHVYADIQYVAKGKEWFCYAPIDKCVEIDPHPENDVYYFNGEMDILTLKDDRFVVVLPDDCHMPERAINEEREPIVKCVLKVKL